MADNIACVIGEDSRMDYVANDLYNYGFEVSRDLKHITDNVIIVLPPVVSEELSKQIIERLSEGQLVYGGIMTNRLLHECSLKKIKAVNYLKIESLVSENAELTAKGIIRQAILNNAVPEGSNCLVLGYGHCGKAIARELAYLNASVDIMVRRKNLATAINDDGYGFVDLNAYEKKPMQKYSYIFNTIPAPVIDSRMIDMLSGDVMIFDIASSPGGTDFEYCKKKNIFAVLSLSIPGKEYPKEAGAIIASAIQSSII